MNYFVIINTVKLNFQTIVNETQGYAFLKIKLVTSRQASKNANLLIKRVFTKINLPSDNETDIENIYTVDYYMNNETLYDLYSSCEEVYYPEMGVPALNLLCGPYGSQCTPEL